MYEWTEEEAKIEREYEEMLNERERQLDEALDAKEESQANVFAWFYL